MFKLVVTRLEDNFVEIIPCKTLRTLWLVMGTMNPDFYKFEIRGKNNEIV